MSFAKYVSLLDRKALHFSRVDCFKDDPLEGALPEHIFDPILEAQATEEQRRILKINKERLKTGNELTMRELVINCWHIDECASDYMWTQFLKCEEGVAIQSTFKRLSDTFANYNENDVYIGAIDYIDHEKDTIPWDNAFYPFVHKNRNKFEHEKELRVVLSKNIRLELAKAQERGYDKIVDTIEFPVNGIEVQIDLQTLIEKVVVSPKAGKWFEEVVQSVTKKYGLNKAVIKSLAT